MPLLRKLSFLFLIITTSSQSMDLDPRKLPGAFRSILIKGNIKEKVASTFWNEIHNDRSNGKKAGVTTLKREIEKYNKSSSNKIKFTDTPYQDYHISMGSMEPTITFNGTKSISSQYTAKQDNFRALARVIFKPYYKEIFNPLGDPLTGLHILVGGYDVSGLKFGKHYSCPQEARAKIHYDFVEDSIVSIHYVFCFKNTTIQQEKTIANLANDATEFINQMNKIQDRGGTYTNPYRGIHDNFLSHITFGTAKKVTGEISVTSPRFTSEQINILLNGYKETYDLFLNNLKLMKAAQNSINNLTQNIEISNIVFSINKYALRKKKVVCIPNERALFTDSMIINHALSKNLLTKNKTQKSKKKKTTIKYQEKKIITLSNISVPPPPIKEVKKEEKTIPLSSKNETISFSEVKTYQDENTLKEINKIILQYQLAEINYYGQPLNNPDYHKSKIGFETVYFSKYASDFHKTNALFILSEIDLAGEGLETPDYLSAILGYESICHNNCASNHLKIKSIHRLAQLQSSGINLHEPDYVSAREGFEAVCISPDAEIDEKVNSYFNLGIMDMYGHGLREPDYKSARQHFTTIIQTRNAKGLDKTSAHLSIALMDYYSKGLQQPDYEAARERFEFIRLNSFVSDKDYIQACYYLAVMDYYGNAINQPDYAKAKKRFKLVYSYKEAPESYKRDALSYMDQIDINY